MSHVLPKTSHSSSLSASPELSSLVAHLKRENPHVFNAAVLPEQFHDAPERAYLNSGVAALMRAVLDDAIVCFQKYSSAMSTRSRRLGKEAEAWLFSNDERWIFSFINVCAVLGLDPISLRRKLYASLHHPSRAPQRQKHSAARRRLHHIARAA